MLYILYTGKHHYFKKAKSCHIYSYLAQLSHRLAWQFQCCTLHVAISHRCHMLWLPLHSSLLWSTQCKGNVVVLASWSLVVSNQFKVCEFRNKSDFGVGTPYIYTLYHATKTVSSVCTTFSLVCHFTPFVSMAMIGQERIYLLVIGHTVLTALRILHPINLWCVENKTCFDAQLVHWSLKHQKVENLCAI